MRGDDYLDLARSVSVVTGGVGQEVEDCSLQLWVQVRFGLFDQEQREVGVVRRLEFDDHGGEEEKVGVARPE